MICDEVAGAKAVCASCGWMGAFGLMLEAHVQTDSGKSTHNLIEVLLRRRRACLTALLLWRQGTA